MVTSQCIRPRAARAILATHATENGELKPERHESVFCNFLAMHDRVRVRYFSEVRVNLVASLFLVGLF